MSDDDSHPLTFHEAWGRAKDRKDYHKPDWRRSQLIHESESHTFADWLRLVRHDDAVRSRINELALENERLRDIRDSAAEAMRVDVVEGREWLESCPAGVRRELRERVGEYEETLVVDRRAVDSRTLSELLAAKPKRVQEHVRVLLDMIEAEDIGETETTEIGP